MPFNLGPLEMIFVMVVLLLLFGAKRLPELGSGLGKGIREFKKSMTDIREEVQRAEPQDQIQAPAPRPQVVAAPEQVPTETETTRDA
jgi:sec-independent protein translocase protein TatA